MIVASMLVVVKLDVCVLIRAHIRTFNELGSNICC